MGFRASVSVLCDWLAGCPPSALSLAKFHTQPLKVFSHVDPVCVRSFIRHPQSHKYFNYVLEGYPLSPHPCLNTQNTNAALFSRP
jgi:hypothetical protein